MKTSSASNKKYSTSRWSGVASAARENVAKETVIYVFYEVVLLGFTLFSLLQLLVYSPPAPKECFAAFALLGMTFALVALMKHARSEIAVLDPFLIISLTLAFVFFFVPVVQFTAGDTALDSYSVDAAHNCFTGTAVVAISYFAFFVGYEFLHTSNKSRIKKAPRLDQAIPEEFEHGASLFVLVLFTISYILCVYSYVHAGNSLQHVLLPFSADNSVIEVAQEKNSLSFLSYLRFSMISLWMMYLVFGKSKVVKVITFIMLFEIIYFGSSRFVLLVLVLAPIIYSALARRRFPSFVKVLAVAVILFVLFAIIQTTRGAIKTGVGISLEGYSFESLTSGFFTELSDYKVYYLLFDSVPARHAFLFGSEMFLQSLTFFIPRAIWPGKPDPAVHEIIRITLGPQAEANGIAYPQMGELYVEFGIAGCIIGMMVFGIICYQLDKLRRHGSISSLALLIYSVAAPSLIQLVIRGYMPQNFSMYVFELLPFLVIWIYINRKAKQRIGFQGEPAVKLSTSVIARHQPLVRN